MIDQQLINQIEILDYLQHCRSLVPGFRKAYAFFYHPVYKELQSVIALSEHEQIKRLDSSSHALTNDIYAIRESKQKMDWVDESNLPFEHLAQTSIKQKEVFDEYKHHILLIKTTNSWDKKEDLLYVFFKPDASNFGLKKTDDKLTTEQKSIISSLLVRSLKIFSAQRKQFQEKNNQLRNDFQLIGNQINEIQIQEKINTQKHQTQLFEYIINLLQREASKLKLHLQLTSEAQSFIKNYQGPISIIEKASINSIMMANRVQGTMEGGLLKLEEYFLKPYFSSDQNIVVSHGVEAMADSRYTKTIHILNRLELAAKKVQSEGKSLNGSNVGLAMETPISAPAISDALKKHKNKIQNLCNEFPDEWKLIRTHFKPIINTLSA